MVRKTINSNICVYYSKIKKGRYLSPIYYKCYESDFLSLFQLAQTWWANSLRVFVGSFKMSKMKALQVSTQ